MKLDQITSIILPIAIVIVAFYWGVTVGHKNTSHADSTGVEVETLYVTHDSLIVVTIPGKIVEVPAHAVDDTSTHGVNPITLPERYTAYCDTVFRNTHATDSVHVEYKYPDNLFKIRSHLSSREKIIIIDSTIYVSTVDKLAYITNAAVHTSKGEYMLTLGAGVRLYERFDILLSATSNKQIGINVGVKIK